MKGKKSNFKKKISKFCIFICSVIIGLGMGNLMSHDILTKNLIKIENPYLNILGFVATLVIGLFLQVIIHETGHLLAGLFSGYGFVSFRIGRFVWIKDKDNKIKLKNIYLPGLIGQCLMAPPNMKNGTFPTLLFNLGGSLLNLLSVFVFGVIFYFFRLYYILLICLFGLLLALSNGIPIKFAMANNDGKNAVEIRKDPQAARSIWVQLKVNEMISKGVRLKDMPEDWFFVPNDDQMKNGVISSMAVLKVNRLTDQQKIEEASELIDKILNGDFGVAGIYLHLLVCDRIFFELIKEGDRNLVDRLYDKQQEKFMNQMNNFPSVIRTQYAYALLYKKDKVKAEKFKKKFEKCARTYPYQSDIESERELMLLVKDYLQTRQNLMQY